MTWSTIEEAWGNESKEDFTNYFENYQDANSNSNNSNNRNNRNNSNNSNNSNNRNNSNNSNNSNTTSPPQKDYTDYEKERKEFDNKISALETNIKMNNQSINKKLDNLTLQIENEIKRVNSQVLNLIESIKNTDRVVIPSNNINSDNQVYFENIHDIILFVIFGVFIIILMDSMYRILLLKIKKI